MIEACIDPVNFHQSIIFVDIFHTSAFVPTIIQSKKSQFTTCVQTNVNNNNSYNNNIVLSIKHSNKPTSVVKEKNDIYLLCKKRKVCDGANSSKYSNR